jgi:hypothetical protein
MDLMVGRNGGQQHPILQYARSRRGLERGVELVVPEP